MRIFSSILFLSCCTLSFLACTHSFQMTGVAMLGACLFDVDVGRRPVMNARSAFGLIWSNPLGGTDACFTTDAVLLVRYQLEVIRVHTCMVATEMIQLSI